MATNPTDRTDRTLAAGPDDDRFRLATRAARLGIVEVRLPQRSLQIDARAGDLLGLSPTAAASDWNRLIDRVHETDRAHVKAAFESIFAGAASLDVSFRVDAGDDTLRFLRAQGCGEAGAGDTPSRLIFSVVDVTASTVGQSALRESEQRFRGAFQYSAMGMALVSPGGEWLQVNRALCDLLGYDEIELKRITFQDITHPDDLATNIGYMTDVLEGRRTHYHMEKRYFHKRGSVVWVLLSVSVVRDEQGTPLHFVSLLQDITERKLAQAALEASLAEKETLVQEIHHRVKNNMQVISSILRLQSRYVADPHYRAMFDECRDRIRTMALVHEKLYRTTNLATLDFGEHLRELAQLSRSTLKMPEERVEVSFDVDDVEMGVELAIPLGLIANELVTNAFKHAFVGRPGGRIAISLEQTGQRLALSVDDDGCGLPPDFDVTTAPSLGLRLVRTLVGQIGGSLAAASQDGTRIHVACDLERR
jgi:PAS domain S-box-containing protein